MIEAVAARPVETVRVMIVDDSVVARALAARWLEAQPGFEVAASCRSGQEALDRIASVRPDVVLLDVEMPGMDGVEALPLLLKARPGLAVLMNSSYTTRGAELSLRCLALGATDVLAKPTSEAMQAGEYRREFLARMQALGDFARRRRGLAPAPRVAAQAAPPVAASRPAASPAAEGRQRVECVAIGSSTGGPQALMEMLRAMSGTFPDAPVIVTQHMPAGFTAALAEHLSRGAGVEAKEAEDREPILPGRVYVAPGGRHLSVLRGGSGVIAKLEDGPPVNFCKPSVDPMFRSASKAYGAGLVAVVLTGMGSDGATAAAAAAAAGGRVIAQDEATSVVWGMPGATAATGACAAVLPLKEIGPRVVRMMERGRS
ncbi:protein-glutamate methylesterase/protein-glutamine glutaminase [Chenggangzhangella methanolivorans]|uniref:Protein-glutamate methylesterase/protein-glutamine glutaminase n=1 Tax=Chenggangzhangella methanolivorans TaxID=1437009 RepID=A0A9E6R6R6_9HYPH|nr:chemotaxis response regulator protein-glutamate methylesterase [Chenggangzhangella methanolivorans]QZN99257.1 chemotaxis response regulator protein-glutamate methylesterase [Chenggangzhangella methanolivorans]